MSSVFIKKLYYLCFLSTLILGACRAEETQEPTATAVSTGPERAAVRVLVAEAKRDRLEVRPNATGLTRAFQRARVAAEVSGRVLRRAAEPGTPVRTGDPLLALDPTRAELARNEAQASLVSRQTDLDEATRSARRGEELASENAISDSELDRLRSRRDRAKAALNLAEVHLAGALQNLADTTVRAPFDGIVESIDVDAGDFIRAGTPVAMVVDLGRVRIHAGVTANEAARLAVGDPVQIVFDAGTGRPYQAAIQSIGQVANPRTGNFSVEIWLPNTDRSIRDGITATLAFNPSARGDAPLIPRAALARSPNGAVVFVVEGTGKIQMAVQRTVRLGRSDNMKIEVLEGVQEGELVIIDGHFALNDGSPVLIDRNNGA
jgi:RND family efflux transporter MFP subunit